MVVIVGSNNNNIHVPSLFIKYFIAGDRRTGWGLKRAPARAVLDFMLNENPFGCAPVANVSSPEIS